MSQYTVNVYSNNWSRQNEIDVDFRVGTGGFYSEVQAELSDFDWAKKNQQRTLGKVLMGDSTDLTIINLQSTCKSLRCEDNDKVITITKDVSNRHTKYAFEHKGKEVAVVSNTTGVFVDGKRRRNVLSAFMEKPRGFSIS